MEASIILTWGASVSLPLVVKSWKAPGMPRSTARVAQRGRRRDGDAGCGKVEIERCSIDIPAVATGISVQSDLGVLILTGRLGDRSAREPLDIERCGAPSTQ